MIQRCTNQGDAKFKDYGARGISVCARWMDFTSFRDDMMPSWKEGLQIDRINNDGNYEPGNCKWSTRAEQLRNTRANVNIEVNGIRKCAMDWGKDLGGNPRLVYNRIKKGWTEQDAVTVPLRPKRLARVEIQVES